MTTETHVMEILERANPVPPGELVDVPVGATRYLETVLQQRSEPMTVIDPTPTRTTDPPRRRWPMVAIAASVVAIVVASIALIVATRDDNTTIVDQPEPTVPPTIAPVPTTAAATDPEAAQAVVDQFFDAYNAGDTDGTLALLSPDMVWTEQFGNATPNPGRESLTALDIELKLAWNHAQGEVWREPSCSLAPDQRPAGTTMSCQWDALDAVAQAVDGDPVPIDALIAVADGRVVELHAAYGAGGPAALGLPFSEWVATYHPGVDVCCGEDTRAASEQQGRQRAQLAAEWAVFLDERGCDPQSCPFPIDEWVRIYEDQCLRLDPPGLPDGQLVDRVRDLPAPASQLLETTRLFDADAALTASGLASERTGELQQQRLDLMIELGIDERCHPVIE